MDDRDEASMAERRGLAVREAVLDGGGAPRWRVALADRAGQLAGEGAGTTLVEALAKALAAAESDRCTGRAKR